MVMSDTVDQVRDALAIAEQRYAAAVAAHGALLEELAAVKEQLRRAVTGRAGRSVLVDEPPTMIGLTDLPRAAEALRVRVDRLDEQAQAAGVEASRLASIVQRGRALLAAQELPAA
jgi:hypothetical protein